MQTVFAQLPLFAELSLRGWFPLWLAVLLALGGMALVGWLYVREASRDPAGPKSVLEGIRALVVGIIAIFNQQMPPIPLRTLFGSRIGMALIRMTIILLVAFLLLRPVWVTDYKGQKRRTVAVLVDVSQSMDSKDPRPGNIDQWRVAMAYGLVPADKPIVDSPVSAVVVTPVPDRPKRSEVVRAAFENTKLNLFGRLNSVGPLEPATFGSRRTGRDWTDPKWVHELAGTEPRTALVNAAFELLARDENDMPAAIVLVTDGRENASDKALDDLARECARLKIPLHVYGVGSSAFGQLQVRDAVVPETVFVDDAVSVPVRYRIRGITDGKVEIVLKYGDRVVAKKEVAVREGDDLREVLTFVPVKQDVEAKRAELTATVTVTTGGATVETLTDEVVKAAKVVSRKLKVLVVDSLPRFDFKFLQRALLRDRRVDAKFYLTEGDRASMKSGMPWLPGFASGRDDFRKELFEYDLVILGDVPGPFFNLDQQEVIREFVAEGGGLIHIAGRWHAPAGWAKTPIADVLPVEYVSVKFPIEALDRPTPFRPQLAPAAARNPLLSLEDDPLDNVKTWQNLPPLYWFYPVTKLKPAAEAYLVHPTVSTPAPDNRPMPLLAGHYYGKGFCLFVGFDETWRWRFNEADHFFGRFWSQAVYAAGVPRMVGTKLTQLSMDTTDPVLGKTGQVYARIFTESFKPDPSREHDAELVKLDADPNDKDTRVKVKLNQLPGQPGEFVATLPYNRTGRFALRVDPGNRNPATLDYRVNLPPEHELAPGGMAEGDMRKLTEATGGGFYREEDLYKLPDEVKPQFAPYSRREETILWNRWAMFALLGLLTVEWVMRKWNSLS